MEAPPSGAKIAELLVALMLVALGIAALGGARETSDTEHHHGHSHVHRRSTIRALWVGMIHGLAGSAAVALLALSAVQERALAVAYLVVFGAGTVVGMTLLTGLLSLPFAWGSRHSDAFGRSLRRTVGLVSVVFGLVLGFHTLERSDSAEVSAPPRGQTVGS